MAFNFIKSHGPIKNWKKEIRNYANQSVEGVQLAFRKYADHTSNKKAILVIHGLFGSKSNWNSVAKIINKKTKREVYCLDARNHGDSPHSPNMTYHHMAKDLEMFINDHKLSSPVIIGHSMGGRAAMCLSLTQPSLISQLCVVDVSPLYTSPAIETLLYYIKLLREIEIPRDMNYSERRKYVDKLLTPNVTEPEMRNFLLMNLDTKNPNNLWKINLPVLESNFETEIAVFPDFSGVQFQKPTLFIAGRLSSYLLPDKTTEILKLYPNAKFVFIENAGHVVHADQPTAFINAVVSFI